MMMHGVAPTVNSTTTTTTATNTATNNNGNNPNKSSNNNINSMLQQQQDCNNTVGISSAHQQQHRETSTITTYRQETLNFGIKLKDTNLAIYTEQQQRKLEMLESRFVPLNPQKVSVISLNYSSITCVCVCGQGILEKNP